MKTIRPTCTTTSGWPTAADSTSAWAQISDASLNYNIEARYPEDRADIASSLTPEACRYFIDETKKLTKWIRDEYSVATKPSASSDATSK